jgi:hypothetical protein
MGAAAGPVNKHAGSLLELGLVPPQQLVLLSPDAPDPLLTLDESRAYVIGGIVDRQVCGRGRVLLITAPYAWPSFRPGNRVPLLLAGLHQPPDMPLRPPDMPLPTYT